MRAFTECPKVGDRVYGRMLASTSGGVVEKQAWGTVFSIDRSTNKQLMSVYVDADGDSDGLNWGCHSFWNIGEGVFWGSDNVLLRPGSDISDAFDRLKQHLDTRSQLL